VASRALLARPLYRSRQVFVALFPRIAAADRALVETLLSGDLLVLFGRMERRDQRHAIEVTRRLRSLGASEPDLLIAALLHDCGKGSVSVWLRVLNVLAPRVVREVSREDYPGWRGAAHRLVVHPQRGASLAAAAGASAVTVRLISGTVEATEQEMLRLLYQADDAS
jgi:HD superfamily phosphodiesterase